MKGDPEQRAVLLGEYIARYGATVRRAAAALGCSKSTVHKDVSVRLRRLDPELFARVQAVLRRTKKSDERYRLDETEIDFAGYDVTVSGERVELTPQEFALLEALVLNRNIALSRERLLAMAWGLDFLGDSRTVDVHIQKLRRKLHFENRIKTIYKVGYRLEDPPKR